MTTELFEYKYYAIVYESTVLEKVVQRKNESEDAKIINARTKSIVEAYNNIVELCAPIFQTKETERIKSVRETLITIRDRLLTCAGIKT